MAQYKPSLPFTTALIVLKPTYNDVGGVHQKVFPDIADGLRINGTFKTYGGTEMTVNGVYSILDTAQVETWYTPFITSDCVIVDPKSDARYEILGSPENINMRNQYLVIKLRRIKGGA